jgi:hypothetical protein
VRKASRSNALHPILPKLLAGNTSAVGRQHNHVQEIPAISTRRLCHSTQVFVVRAPGAQSASKSADLSVSICSGRIFSGLIYLDSP